LHRAYPESDAVFCVERFARLAPCSHPTSRSLGDWVSHPGSPGPLLQLGEEAGPSRVTGSSSSYAPWPGTPSLATHPRPSCGCATTAFGHQEILGWGTLSFRGWIHHSSYACLTTHQPPRYRKRLQAWLPACRAQLWPGGFCTHWTTNPKFLGVPHPHSFPDQHCLVATL